MTEERRNALKKAAEVCIKGFHKLWHSLQQVGNAILQAWRKHVRRNKMSRKQRRRMLEEIKKQPAQVIKHHPNCRHQVTPYNPHVVVHNGPMPGHDMETSYRIVEPPYKSIVEQNASADQVGQAMHAAANAAADGFKAGLENRAPIGSTRQCGKTGMVQDLLLADHKVILQGETVMLRTLSHYTGHTPTELFNRSRQELEAAYATMREVQAEGTRNPGTLADLLKQREERREAEKVLHFGNGADVTLGTLSKYTRLSVSTIADMDGMELAFLYASVKEQIEKDQAAEGETTEVAQQVRASLQRIHDAGYDPQAAEEAKERAREVERELLEAKRDELQQALRYTKKSVRKKNIERQIAEIDQRLAEIPAGVKK